jgi:hypothetical protein
MCRGIGKWIDDLQLLDDRAGPPVRDDERQRVLMFRTNVDELDSIKVYRVPSPQCELIEEGGVYAKL